MDAVFCKRCIRCCLARLTPLAPASLLYILSSPPTRPSPLKLHNYACLQLLLWKRLARPHMHTRKMKTWTASGETAAPIKPRRPRIYSTVLFATFVTLVCLAAVDTVFPALKMWPLSSFVGERSVSHSPAFKWDEVCRETLSHTRAMLRPSNTALPSRTTDRGANPGLHGAD